MPARTSLSKAMQPKPAPTTAAVPPPPPSPGRTGKKVIAGFFDPAVSRQLKSLAIDVDSNVQQLLAEALNDLFEKHGRARIA